MSLPRRPREIRFENKRRYNIELYEDEVKILKNLIRGEIADVENRQDDVIKNLKEYSQQKVVMALQELIWEYDELEGVLNSASRG